MQSAFRRSTLRELPARFVSQQLFSKGLPGLTIHLTDVLRQAMPRRHNLPTCYHVSHNFAPLHEDRMCRTSSCPTRAVLFRTSSGSWWGATATTTPDLSNMKNGCQQLYHLQRILPPGMTAFTSLDSTCNDNTFRESKIMRMRAFSTCVASSLCRS